MSTHVYSWTKRSQIRFEFKSGVNFDTSEQSESFNNSGISRLIFKTPDVKNEINYFGTKLIIVITYKVKQ